MPSIKHRASTTTDLTRADPLVSTPAGAGTCLSPPIASSPSSGAALRDLPLEDVLPFRFNPRKAFDSSGIEELARHVREVGVLVPVIVRAGAFRRGRQTYDLVCGERRWRAADMAGLSAIPAVVWDGVSHGEAVAAALSENLHREDLGAMEVAAALQSLCDLGVRKADIARRVGRSASYVSNHLRLLSLPPEVRAMLSEGALSGALARAALSVMAKIPETSRINPERFLRAVAEDPAASVHRLERLEIPEGVVRQFPALRAAGAQNPIAAPAEAAADETPTDHRREAPRPSAPKVSARKVSTAGAASLAGGMSAIVDIPGGSEAPAQHTSPVRLPGWGVRLAQLPPASDVPLTERQRQVLWLAAEGLDAEETAAALSVEGAPPVSARSAHVQRRRAVEAVGARSLTQAAVWAALQGLLPQDGGGSPGERAVRHR